MLGNKQSDNSWKTQSYIVGAVLGVLLGVFSAYLYVRAADDPNVIVRERSRRISNGQVFGLFMSLLPLMRIIADLGKDPEDNKRR
jgi:hypothetical protein